MTTTIYDVTIHMPQGAAPGLKQMTDIIFDAIAKECRLDEYSLGVEVKGPPELSIGVRFA